VPAFAFITKPGIAGDDKPLPTPASRTIDFDKDVRPIFAAHCLECHGLKKQKSDFRLDRKASALKGGDNGPAIIPAKSGESPLIRRVAGIGDEEKMPPKGPPLSAEQVGVLRAWIDQGAKWPEAVAGVEKPHWAYQPLIRPGVPELRSLTLPARHDHCNVLDAFILAKLREKGLTPSPPADKRTWLRRVTFDLIGLPPTPEELQTFLADDSPGAFERVVDRLLASPRYGERWARHWMDVAHFAETHGHDQDRPRPNAWPYRDYLIRSFNEDKSYARFVAEQVAGDVLFPDDPQATVALGFLAAGPWDESSLRDIVADTLDNKIAQVLDRDNMLTTVMTTFVSATVNCARCHNHKFDPISQQDYYALQAVFAGVDRAERPFDPDPRLHAHRSQLLARKNELERGLPEAELLSADVQEQVAKWDAAASQKRDTWKVLEPVAFRSAHGSQAVKQPDGSLLYGGVAPEKDTYFITTRVKGTGITAVRLEVLADPSLPKQGPGRQDNGNLHLSEFRVLLESPLVGVPIPLPIRRASADFDQQGWTISQALDGKPATAWGIYPEVGRPHAAVFELERPLDASAGLDLTFVLQQLHGTRHLIGRPRFSCTTAKEPARVRPLPAAVTRILEVPAEDRSSKQRGELAAFLLRQKVDEELSALPPPRMVYAATHDFKPEMSFKPSPKPRPVHVLKRGDIQSPLEPAKPGTLSCVSGLPCRFSLTDADDEGTRRAALAHWLVDPNNVLTWRSIVNRVWHYHFGRGIVDTPNDFGRMGGTPSHPELLDWLAVEFRDSGGSLKRLHKLIVMSGAYRQSSKYNEANSRLDADNRLLWRMNACRLDAESLHDAVLQISGKLDWTMSGPSVKQFIQTPGVHVTPVVDYVNFPVDDPANCRRSVYRFLFRTLPDPFMESMDCPDCSQQMPVRSSSVTALQSLALLNDKFIVRQCEHIASRLQHESTDRGEQIRLLFNLALNREPRLDELKAISDHAAKHGLANACRVILNSNEFVFVD
jgi:hypothetical protein